MTRLETQTTKVGHTYRQVNLSERRTGPIVLVLSEVIVGLRTLTYKPEIVPSSYLMGTFKLVPSSPFDARKFLSFSAISSMCCRKLMNSKGLQEDPTPT